MIFRQGIQNLYWVALFVINHVLERRVTELLNLDEATFKTSRKVEYSIRCARVFHQDRKTPNYACWKRKTDRLFSLPGTGGLDSRITCLPVRLASGGERIRVKETGAGGYSEDDYKLDLEIATKFLKEQLGDKLTIDTIQLDGAQATSFEYSIEDAIAVGLLSEKSGKKAGVKSFMTKVEACHMGYHLESDIAGYDESERESIRDHMLDSIKWDGTGIGKED